MIPVLYDELKNLVPSNDPDKENTVKANLPSHRIGYLRDTMSCKVTEERNGSYELILTYPISGKLFSEIIPGRAIMAKAHPTGDDQLFRIYRTSKVLRGVITVYARHISYDLCGIPMQRNGDGPAPATAQNWLNYILLYTEFTGHSDMTATHFFDVANGVFSIKAFLGGIEGSLLDTFRGEYEWDNYVINYNTARGSDKGVVVEYGKNLTELTMEQDYSEVYTAVQPFARYVWDFDGATYTVMPNPIPTGVTLDYKWVKILDVTDDLGLDPGAVPTDAQITDAANAWLAKNPLGVPAPTIKVSLVDNHTLKIASIELCDTVTVRYTQLGVSVKQKVVQTEFNTLLERYDNIVLGTTAGNLAGSFQELQVEVANMKTEKPRFTSGSKVVDLTDGVVYVVNGTDTATLSAQNLKLKSSDGTVTISATGRASTGDSGEDSISSGSYTTVADVTIPKGTWLIQASARFPANSTGRRAILIGGTRDNGTTPSDFYIDSRMAITASGIATVCAFSTVRHNYSDTTLYLTAYQNSGSAQSVKWAYQLTRIV